MNDKGCGKRIPATGGIVPLYIVGSSTENPKEHVPVTCPNFILRRENEDPGLTPPRPKSCGKPQMPTERVYVRLFAG